MPHGRRDRICERTAAITRWKWQWHNLTLRHPSNPPLAWSHSPPPPPANQNLASKKVRKEGGEGGEGKAGAEAEQIMKSGRVIGKLGISGKNESWPRWKRGRNGDDGPLAPVVHRPQYQSINSPYPSISNMIITYLCLAVAVQQQQPFFLLL